MVIRGQTDPLQMLSKAPRWSNDDALHIIFFLSAFVCEAAQLAMPVI